MYPYVRQASGISRLELRVSEEARLNMTPFPCGRCLFCRINKARVWVSRILLEASVHGDSCFLTLTYNDESLPYNNSLCPVDVTFFLKKLRRSIGKLRFRYFLVGEYGHDGNRQINPHYHAVLFGLGKLHAQVIEKAWTVNGDSLGFVHVGDLNKNSARYITNYVLKAMHNPRKPWVRKYLDGRYKEFMRCSKMNGGLGYCAIEKIAVQLIESKVYNNSIIRSLLFGRRNLPLGRYLSQVFIDMMDLDDEAKKDLFNYQEAIFDKHILDNKFYYSSLVEEDHSKRLSAEKRFKIFQKRNSKL